MSLNPFILKIMLEALGIALGLTIIVCVIPIQAFADREISVVTVISGVVLWIVIVRNSLLFDYLMSRWFKK